MQTRTISLGQLVVPFFHMSTTVWLSQCTNIFFRDHWWPQVLTAEAMTNSSFQAMSLLIWSGGHRAWIQFSDQYAPQPRVPDASVNRNIDEEVDQLVFRMHAVPFHVGRKASHQSSSRYALMHSWR